MPDNSSEHPAADRAMRWLGNNWYVPIVAAIDMAIISRPHAGLHHTVPENPAIAGSTAPEILPEKLASCPREEPGKPQGKQLPSPGDIANEGKAATVQEANRQAGNDQNARAEERSLADEQRERDGGRER